MAHKLEVNLADEAMRPALVEALKSALSEEMKTRLVEDAIFALMDRANSYDRKTPLGRIFDMAMNEVARQEVTTMLEARPEIRERIRSLINEQVATFLTADLDKLPKAIADAVTSTLTRGDR